MLWHEDQVLQVPASALFRLGDKWAVFVVEDGKARRRTVSVGHSSGLATQVLDGLQPGETVILHPDDRLVEGVRVMTN
jgi:HlyD family secretion protein